MLAVCAALGSLLSGHAANEALLLHTKAADQWNFFQAKSTKGHIYESGREIVKALLEVQGTSEKAHSVLERFEQQVKKYKEEKEEPQQKAEHMTAEGDRQLEKHHFYSLGVAAFQVGIVLASISIMVRYRPVWVMSLAGGATGIILLIAGFLK